MSGRRFGTAAVPEAGARRAGSPRRTAVEDGSRRSQPAASSAGDTPGGAAGRCVRYLHSAIGFDAETGLAAAPAADHDAEAAFAPEKLAERTQADGAADAQGTIPADGPEQSAPDDPPKATETGPPRPTATEPQKRLAGEPEWRAPEQEWRAPEREPTPGPRWASTSSKEGKRCAVSK